MFIFSNVNLVRQSLRVEYNVNISAYVSTYLMRRMNIIHEGTQANMSAQFNVKDRGESPQIWCNNNTLT